MSIPTPNRAVVVNGVSFLCLITAPLWLYLLLFPAGYGYDYANGLVAFIVVLIIDVALVMHVSRDDGELRKILTAGLFFKFVATTAYLTFMIHYYQGGDFLFYFDQGREIAKNLINHGEFGQIAGVGPREGINGTTLLHQITGLLFVVTGPTLTGGVLVFSSLAYWGVFLFWKAFVTAFPQADTKTAAALLFFMPSVAFWPATIGKDAIMSFSIGLTAYGLAGMIYRARIGALGLMTAGVLVTAAIRPHIGAILALSLAVIYLFGQNRAGIAGMLAKLIGIPLIIFGTYYVFTAARERLGLQDAEHAQQYLKGWSEVTNYGGSGFSGGSLVQRVALAPLLPFRPFPWEISSVQTLIASAEGMFLLALLWVSRRSLKFSIMRWRSHPFIGFILFFSLETAVALSCAFSNFGLLARERVMFTPLLLMLAVAFPAAQAKALAATHTGFPFGRVS